MKSEIVETQNNLNQIWSNSLASPELRNNEICKQVDNRKLVTALTHR